MSYVIVIELIQRDFPDDGNYLFTAVNVQDYCRVPGERLFGLVLHGLWFSLIFFCIYLRINIIFKSKMGYLVACRYENFLDFFPNIPCI